MTDSRNYHTSETLDDGTEIEIRAITPADGPNILEAFRGLNREAVYRRFFAPKKDLTKADIEQLTEVDCRYESGPSHGLCPIPGFSRFE